MRALPQGLRVLSHRFGTEHTTARLCSSLWPLAVSRLGAQRGF
jgi:hypothetical protein